MEALFFMLFLGKGKSSADPGIIGFGECLLFHGNYSIGEFYRPISITLAGFDGISVLTTHAIK
jgi:hypothetical protein